MAVDLDCRDHPNRLFIEDALDDDTSVVRLSSSTMDKLELFCGDTVKLKGKNRCETICIVLSDDTCSDDHIRVNHVTQNNLRVHAGDIISIQGCPHVKYGTRIHVVAIADTVNDNVGNLLQEYLQCYFLDAYRPVCVGDTFIVRIKTDTVEFKVIDTEPSPHCIVAPETIIDCEGEPIERKMEERLIDKIDFDDIGGLEDVKKVLTEFIQYSTEHHEKYLRFGMAPPRGMLLYGPTGCGKTMLVKALANECNVNFISLNSVESLYMSYDHMTENVRNTFDKARQMAPCILFIDDLDFKVRDDNVIYEDLSADRLVNQIITEIDGISSKTKVFIIGTTNRPDLIDLTLLRPGSMRAVFSGLGRFDQSIYVPLPDEKSRHDILKIVLRKYRVAKDVDLTILAKVLRGVSGASIAEMCRRAAKLAIQESIENEQKTEWPNQGNDSNATDVVVGRDHFNKIFAYHPHLVASDNDIRKYELFAQIVQSHGNYVSSFHKFKFSENINENGNAKQESTFYTDDDDLYA